MLADLGQAPQWPEFVAKLRLRCLVLYLTFSDSGPNRSSYSSWYETTSLQVTLNSRILRRCTSVEICFFATFCTGCIDYVWKKWPFFTEGQAIKWKRFVALSVCQRTIQYPILQRSEPMCDIHERDDASVNNHDAETARYERHFHPCLRVKNVFFKFGYNIW